MSTGGSRPPLDECRGGEAQVAEEAEELFKEIPTAANLTQLPTDEAGGGGLSPLTQRDGAGAYRLVRPTTLDVIDATVPCQTDTPAPKGVAIGKTRKGR